MKLIAGVGEMTHRKKFKNQILGNHVTVFYSVLKTTHINT